MLASDRKHQGLSDLTGSSYSSSLALPPALRWPDATDSEAELPRMVRLALVFVMVSITILSRFGINFGQYSQGLGLIAMYVLVAALLATGVVRLDLKSASFYVIAVTVALLSYTVNSNAADGDNLSTNSLMLLIAIHLPLVLSLRPRFGGEGLWTSVVSTFSNVLFVCALAGILQFYLQFFVKAPWLFDFSNHVPEALQGPSGYNTTIRVGSLFKSNGFFFREPSGFSFMMALGLLLEWVVFRRSVRIVSFGLALLLSYSGTGLLALLVGLMFPLGARTLTRIALLSAGGLVVMLLLGDALNLSFTLGRVSEFGDENASAHIRYVAPLRLVQESFDSVPWGPLVGLGPGSIRRTATTYVFHDPTWARLIFEYGLLGFGAFVSWFCYLVNRFSAPVGIRMAILAYWLIMGGHLLTPDVVAVIALVAALWPRKRYGYEYESTQA